MKRLVGLFLAVLSTQGLFANARGCYDNGNCNVDCCPDWNFCDADFYASVDWLYWKARRCDLDLGTYNGVGTLSSVGDAVAVVPFEGNVICIHPKYESGVRVAAGMEWCSGWGFGFEYIYFNPCDNRHEPSPTVGSPNLVLTRVAGLSSGLDLGSITDVRGHFNLKLNQLDLLFTHKHGCDPCRDVRSFFGVRLAWIDDTLSTVYTGTGPEGIGGTFAYRLREKQDLNAYGLMVGGQVFQDLWCSLGLYLKAGFSVLYGSYDQHSWTTYASTATPTSLPPTAVGYNVKDDCSCLVSVLDLAVGLGFEGCEFCCAKWSVILGYEFHNWFAYRDYLRPQLVNLEGTGTPATLNVLARNKSDLGFDGLFLRLGVEF